MDYLSLLLQAKQDKIAVITDKECYTYGGLYKAASQIRDNAQVAAGAVFIYEDTIIEQLLKFLAFSGTDKIPVIAAAASKGQDLSAARIPEKACMGVMTSGSTGRNKLLWRSFHSWYDFFPEQNKVFQLNADTIMFCQGSLAFTGNLNLYLSVLYAGGTLVVTEKFCPRHWLRMMKDNNVNTVYLIPSKLLLLIKAADEPNCQVEHIVSGSQSMGSQEARRLKQIFPQSSICLYYGASELNYISYIKDSDMTDDETNIGRPFKNVQVFIRNEEIFIDTEYGVEGITRPFSLKDKGYIDEDGCLHFLGRTDDIYNVNGIKVSAGKIEREILHIAPAAEAAVLLCHKNDADYLLACVGSDDLLSKQELVAELKKQLTVYEIPKKIFFFPELPKNESGKIDKLKLREKIGGGK